MARQIQDFARVRIQPVKHLTPKLWQELKDIFSASYGQPTQKTGDVARQIRDVAIMYLDDRMVGFITVTDYTRLAEIAKIEHAGGVVPSLWHPRRPAQLNRRQIQECWVHPRYRGQGLATRLYQYAIQHMMATSIHISESRVFDRIDYWRNLGFTKTILYTVGNDEPTLRLHTHTDDSHFDDLSQIGLYRAFARRDMELDI